MRTVESVDGEVEDEAWKTEESGAETLEVREEMKSIQTRVGLHLKMRARNRTI